MIVETCNRDTWMNQFYPNVAQRLCMLDKKWQDAFCRCFIDQVSPFPRFEGSSRRSIS